MSVQLRGNFKVAEVDIIEREDGQKNFLVIVIRNQQEVLCWEITE